MTDRRAQLEAELELVDAEEALAAAKAKRADKPTDKNVADYRAAVDRIQALRATQRAGRTEPVSVD